MGSFLLFFPPFSLINEPANTLNLSPFLCSLKMLTSPSPGSSASHQPSQPFLSCVSLHHRLTGYGIHHCFARSMVDHEAEEITMFHNFYADYFTMAGIAVASCMALCPAVGLMGRRGGLLMFMIITALASLLQLGLLNREYSLEGRQQTFWDGFIVGG